MEDDQCDDGCACPDPLASVSGAVISLIKSVRQKPPAQDDYFTPNEKKFWTLEIESPFPHYWTFGFNKNIPLANLTTSTESKIVFASGRFAVVYDYEFETMVSLEGHKNSLRSLSVDASGRFMASCDGNCGNKIVLWDLQKSLPIHVIYDFIKTDGASNVWLSPCARYLIVHRQNGEAQELYFYNWADSSSDSKITVLLDPSLDPIKKLVFSFDKPEFFMITTEKYVIFLTFVHGTKSSAPKIRIHNGEFERDRNVGKFTDSTYLNDTHLCYSATDSGHVRVWSDLDYYDGLCEDAELSNFKNEIAYSHVSKCKITVICTVGKYVVLGNEWGKIQFYTNTLILVYWFEHNELDSIESISFNTDEGEFEHLKQENNRKRANTLFVLGKLCTKIRRNVDDWQKPKDVCYVLPRTLDEEPEVFSVRDCIVRSKNERVAYINFTSRSIEYLLENFVNDVVAMECHPLRSYIALATSVGFLFLVDYVMNQEVVRRTVIPLNVTSKGSLSAKGTVRCMKYSQDGLHLACGLSNGHIVFLSPLMLECRHVAKYTERPIRILRFSPDGSVLVACDTTNIYFIEMDTPPQVIASQKTHGRAITDVLFFTQTTGKTLCFSVGKDKNLVQYNLQKTIYERVVCIKKCIRIEQRSDPLCLSLAPDPRKIFVGKSNYKLDMINVKELDYTNSNQSPALNNPVNKLCLLNDTSETEYLFFTACNQIGLIKLPLDTSPYKWISIYVSENKITHYNLSRGSNFVFTLSKGEGIVNMWRVMTGLLEKLSRNVGSVEGSRFDEIFGQDKDFLLKEIKDYFAYASLMHHGDTRITHPYLSRTIPLCEVPDILRAMGCFLTNYEMENAIRKGEPREKFKIKDRRIDFDELVDLYANNRELAFVDLNQLHKAFLRLCSLKNKPNRGHDNTISRSDFIHVLMSKGEAMQSCEALHFLRTLVDPLNKQKYKIDAIKQKLANRNEEDPLVDFMFLPDLIDFEFFVGSILGLSDKSLDIKDRWMRKKKRKESEDLKRAREAEKEQTAELAYRHKYLQLGIAQGKYLLENDPCDDEEQQSDYSEPQKRS